MTSYTTGLASPTELLDFADFCRAPATASGKPCASMHRDPATFCLSRSCGNRDEAPGNQEYAINFRPERAFSLSNSFVPPNGNSWNFLREF